MAPLNSLFIHGSGEFQHITSDKIEKIIDKINIKKAFGFDNIPAKVIKQCKPIISNQLTSLINLSIDTGVSFMKTLNKRGPSIDPC
jgi:isopentenyl phosphate kinase